MPAPKLSTRLKITVLTVFAVAGLASLYIGSPIERFRMNEEEACEDKCKKLNKVSRLVPARPAGTIGQGKYDGPWTCECY